MTTASASTSTLVPSNEMFTPFLTHKLCYCLLALAFAQALEQSGFLWPLSALTLFLGLDRATGQTHGGQARNLHDRERSNHP